MGMVSESAQGLKLWQIAVLIAVLVAAAVGVYGVLTWTGDSGGEARIGDNQQLIPVEYGDVVNQVSTSGSLAYANRTELTFGSQGAVGEVVATAGQEVKAGDIVARLDTATVVSLEKTVAQAELNLKKAQEALDTLKSLPDADDVAKAQSQVDSAKIALGDAQEDAKSAKKDWDAKVEAAQDAADTAAEAYNKPFSKWMDITLSAEERSKDPDSLLASWKADLAAMFSRAKRLMEAGEDFPADDPATRWNEAVTFSWLKFYPGQILATCDDGKVPFMGACIKKEMTDPWDAYEKASDNLATVQLQAARAIRNAEIAVTRAQDSLKTAEDNLATAKTGPDPLEVAVKEAEVKSAQVALDTARQRLDAAVLKSPVAGVVTAVNVVTGQNVSAATVIAEVVDPNVVELNGVVAEIDVLFVKEGARADVTMDALPGQVIEGTVSEIAAAGQSQQGVVNYPIKISIEVPEGVQLREGLSATASIIIREQNNVLLVPLQALYGSYEQPVVKVMSDGKVLERSVTLGNSDDTWVAVTQGLNQGDKVVMQTTQATTSGQLGGAFRVMQGMQGGQFQFGVPGVVPGAGAGRTQSGAGTTRGTGGAQSGTRNR